ncbi:HAUS augmin-like complex subunit 8 [Montipora foliosa]|uniref:HAUS augmin-like complex subunit 8 n=1 Tax=Montipora foliosa TaxID=591990 RepID=UPI0035F1CCEC
MAASSKRSLYNPAPSQTPPAQARKSLVQGVLVSEPSIHGSASSAISSITYIPDQSLPINKERQQTSPVLLVDASGPRKSPDLAEVPVVTSIINSPVRVVCHSPQSTGRNRLEKSVVFEKSDDRLGVTGHLDEGRRVKVSTVPSVNLLNSNTKTKASSILHLSPDSLDDEHLPDDLTSEHPIDDSLLGHNSQDTEEKTDTKCIGKTTTQFKSFLGEEGYHAPPLSAHLPASEIKQQLFDFSQSDGSQAGEGDVSILPSEEKHGLKQKKKKQKTARIVPSRYMEKTKVTRQVKVPHPPKKVMKTPAASLKSKHQSVLITHSADSTLNLDAITPFVPHTTQQKMIVTSTPADGMVGAEPLAHMAAAPTPILPQGIATAVTVGAGASAIRKASRDKIKVQKNVQKSQLSSSSQAAQQTLGAKPPVPKKVVHTASEDPDVSQCQLELQYSRVVQASFLYSRLKHSFAQKEKDAQAQIYSVWQEKEKLQREVANLELQLKMKKKIAELDQHIHLQMLGLKPIGSDMSKLILEYNRLAAALDTTLHVMSVNGVSFPDNHDELFAELDRSERLLGEIDQITKLKQREIQMFATEMDGLSKTVESEIQEQKRCGELLAAASSLGTQERSLQAECFMNGSEES